MVEAPVTRLFGSRRRCSGPDLENIPDLPLPDGVEMRHVTPEMMRPILEAHNETSGRLGLQEPTEEDFQRCSTIRCSMRRCGRSPGWATSSSAR